MPGDDLEKEEMKHLLIAAALSLGFSGACLAAQPHQATNHITQTSSVKPQYPNAAHSKALACHMVGHKDVCKPVSSS